MSHVNELNMSAAPDPGFPRARPMPNMTYI